MHKITLKEHAKNLRANGYSYLEISNALNISKSTAHLWTKEIIVRQDGQVRLHQRYLIGQRKSVAVQALKRVEQFDKIQQEKKLLLARYQPEQIDNDILCALIYWCEGAKSKECVKFTNSDPNLIRTFLNLFRKSFPIQEPKLRIIMHLHEYHNESIQKEFWSKLTGIPPIQFYRSYLKPHTGKRKRKDYPWLCLYKLW